MDAAGRIFMYAVIAVLGVCSALRPTIIPLVLLVFFALHGHFFKDAMLMNRTLPVYYAVLHGMYFLMGAWMCFYFHRLPQGIYAFALAMVAVLIAIHTPYARAALLLLLPYLVMCVAFAKAVPLNNFARYGDFSYGLYIYAFPVQQFYAHAWGTEKPFAAYVAACVLTTLCLAVLSWHVVEKHALRLK